MMKSNLAKVQQLHLPGTGQESGWLVNYSLIKYTVSSLREQEAVEGDWRRSSSTKATNAKVEEG